MAPGGVKVRSEKLNPPKDRILIRDFVIDANIVLVRVIGRTWIRQIVVPYPEDETLPGTFGSGNRSISRFAAGSNCCRRNLVIRNALRVTCHPRW